MRRSLLLVTLLVACGGKDTEPSLPPATGPVYTPAVQYALHGLAPECTLARSAEPGVRKQYTCLGRAGRAVVYLGDGDRFRRLEVELRPMTVDSAQVILTPALGPLVGEPGIAQLTARLGDLGLGETAAIDLAPPRATLAARGDSAMLPAYAVDLTW